MDLSRSGNPASTPASRLTSLPLELIDKICQPLDKKSLMALRLASKIFSTCAEPYLFEEVTLEPRQNVLDGLYLLSKERRLAQHVSCLVVEATCFDSLGRDEWDARVKGYSSESSHPLSKIRDGLDGAGLDLAYQNYRQLVEDQTEFLHRPADHWFYQLEGICDRLPLLDVKCCASSASTYVPESHCPSRIPRQTLMFPSPDDVRDDNMVQFASTAILAALSSDANILCLSIDGLPGGVLKYLLNPLITDFWPGAADFSTVIRLEILLTLRPPSTRALAENDVEGAKAAEKLFKSCPELMFLSWIPDTCYSFGGSEDETLAKCLTMPQLETLWVCNCYCTFDRLLTALGRGAPSLEQLHLSGIRLDDGCWSEIFRMMSAKLCLKDVNLWGSFSDEKGKWMIKAHGRETGLRDELFAYILGKRVECPLVPSTAENAAESWVASSDKSMTYSIVEEDSDDEDSDWAFE